LFCVFVYVGIEYVFIIIILYAKANLHDVSPFVSSCTVRLPVTLLHIHSVPNFAFRSPSKYYVPFWNFIKYSCKTS